MSTIRVNTLQNTSTTDGGISIDNSGHVTVDGVAMPSAGPLSNRNKIINGDMRIDQRNAGSSVTINATAKAYTVDRWHANGQSSDGVFTVQQSTTAPAGFTNSLLATVTTADASIGADQYYLLCQRIEGYNVADLDFGSAAAKTVTLSFWVRSSLTGTFSGALENSAENRAYPFTYSISSADTWEQKTITIAGDTSGTWLTNNGIGMFVWFDLGCGSNKRGTAGSWTGSNFYGATGAVQLIATNGATFYLTGVQLEAGSVATPFEHRSYGQELSLCQRYYEKSYDQGTTPGTSTTTGLCSVNATTVSNTYRYYSIEFAVEKRGTPTITTYAQNGTLTQATNAAGTNLGANSAQAVLPCTRNFAVSNNRGSDITVTTNCIAFHYTASAEL